jgi:hypothetical protein
MVGILLQQLLQLLELLKSDSDSQYAGPGMTLC